MRYVNNVNDICHMIYICKSHMSHAPYITHTKEASHIHEWDMSHNDNAIRHMISICKPHIHEVCHINKMCHMLKKRNHIWRMWFIIWRISLSFCDIRYVTHLMNMWFTFQYVNHIFIWYVTYRMSHNDNEIRHMI